LSEDDLNDVIKKMWTHLQERVSYCFVNRGIGDPKQNLLSYWAKRILKTKRILVVMVMLSINQDRRVAENVKMPLTFYILIVRPEHSTPS
jgi:hypothetical protein